MFDKAYQLYQQKRKLSPHLLMSKLKIRYDFALELCKECWHQGYLENMHFQKSLDLDERLSRQKNISPRDLAYEN